MLVFVAGGSGAIGRPLVSRLARAGPNVVATTRAAEQAQLLWVRSHWSRPRA